MGSGGETVRETVAFLQAQGERVGVAQLRLYRPFPAQALAQALPASVRRVAVLDRTKEPGSLGEPLFLDVLAALSESHADGERELMPSVIGGRYGLSSKEFTPAMVAGVFEELRRERPKRRFTIGINDDVSSTSLPYDASLDIEPAETVRAVFFGLGADGTVGANKNTIKILGSEETLHAQGYFVYDSKKSGSQTVSHLRFGPEPIRAPYLISQASFVGCHQFGLLERAEVLDRAAPGATLLLNCRQPPDGSGTRSPRPVQEQILAKQIKLYVIDAGADRTGCGPRRADQHGASDLLLRDLGRAGARRGDRADQGFDRQDLRQARCRGRQAQPDGGRPLAGAPSPCRAARAGDAERELAPIVPAHAPEFVRTVTAAMMAGRGDQLPVSALPVDGTYPSGTTQYEKRNISELVAVWDYELCIQCGNCSFVCPHSVIRSREYEHPAWRARRTASGRLRSTLPGSLTRVTRCRCTSRTAPDAGCASRPARSSADGDPRTRRSTSRRASRWCPPSARTSRSSSSCRRTDRSRVDFGTVRGTQFLEPLFEFSGACAGCGETPYLKLVSQLFGDRLTIANATGCSSIYGGNLPTTPWTVDADGHGPAWSNSLFEDNAEFGLGLRLAADRHTDLARRRLAELRDGWAAELVDEILEAPQLRESELRAQRQRLGELAAAAGRVRRSRGRRPAQRRRLPAPAQRVDRRRRWLGVRHRVRRPRSRAGQRTQRQRARARHRDVLQHGRADVEGDSARRGGEVRCPQARRCRPRTSRCRRSPTPTCTSPGSRWAPTRNRR